MHVSDKVSYHLSDAFFSHLLEADMVANESEPSTWMDLYGVLTPNNDYYNKFYTKFYLKPLVKNDLYPLFHSNNFNLNNLLFRTNEYQKEYQEETYLDMFIYRTGKKYNKKTVGLEDTKASIIGIMNADLTNAKPKEENIAALQKILKNSAYEEVMMNFYRDKDLDMIDSLTVLSGSENYLKALLYDRNVIMVKSIDSLARKGSLFAAVGAAHLPGKKGIIEMLRKKGYTVTPVFGNYTDAGKAKKQEIEEYFVKPTYTKRSTQDGMVTLPLYTSIIENGENLESPDLANGGYINMKRLPLFDYLKKDNKPFNPKTLDSLFYENIPGKILDKKAYTQNGYQVFDIKSITKTGNAQRYKYFITPLEIITINMAGEEDYVRKFEDGGFDNIALKNVTDTWSTISPKRGGFSLEMPSYNIIYGDGVNNKTVSDIDIYAYDTNEKANYFVLERTLTENDRLENSEFELKRIQYEFYRQFNIDSTNTSLQENPLGFTSQSKIGDKTIRLKTFLKGAKYYMMGSVGASEDNTNRFFNSFEYTPANFNDEFRTYTDTTAQFSVQIPKAQNEKLDFEVKRQIRNNMEKVNEFSEKRNHYAFTLPSGQTVNLWYYKANKYQEPQSIDTLWNEFRNLIKEVDENQEEDAVTTEYAETDNGPVEPEVFLASGKKGAVESLWNKIITGNLQSQNKIELLNEKTSYNEQQKSHQISVTAVSAGSQQSLLYKMVYRNGAMYIMNALSDRNNKESDPYINKVFDSFLLLDDSQPVFPEDKVKLFIEDAKSEYDSIRYSAFKSASNLTIKKENLEDLENFIRTFQFKADETETLATLYEKTGLLKDDRVIPFLEAQYKKENTNTVIQFAILRALSYQKSKEGYKKIMELLEYDLPLSANSFELSLLFAEFQSDPKNSEVLFPDVLQFYSIQEYHLPIVDFTAALLDSKSIKPKKLKSYIKMIITNAKLELKRAKSREANKEIGDMDDYYFSPINQTQALVSYVNLLYPFRNDKEVKLLFENIKKLNPDSIDIEFARLNIVNDDINKNEILKLLKDPQSLFITYNMLYKKAPGLIKDITDEEIAKSGVIALYQLKTENDSLTLIEKKVMPFYKNSVSFYFYKVRTASEESYDVPVNRTVAIAFINNPDGSINPRAYKRLNAIRIVDEAEIPQHIDRMIDATLNENRPRATFGKIEDEYEMSYDEYEY